MRMLSASRGIVLLLAFAATLLVASGFLSPYWVGLLTEALIWALFAMSLDILLGHTGLPSLGHAAFYGMGAYAAAVWFLHGSRDFWTCAVVGVTSAAVLALVYGLLALRTKGVYFLMITLALAQVLWGIAYSWRSVTNGDDGLRSIKRAGIEFLSLNLGETMDYFVFVLAIFVLVAAALFVIQRSPFGYVLRGIRDSAERMEALGYNTWLYKLCAFTLSGALSGLAGVLYVFNNNYVSPEVLSVTVSAEAMLMIILGGAGTFFGPLIGAFAIILLSYGVSSFTEHWTLVLGAIYVAVIIFAPDGLAGMVARRRGKDVAEGRPK